MDQRSTRLLSVTRHLPDGVRPDDNKIATLTRMPMRKGIKKLCSLLGGLSYYRTFLPNVIKRVSTITALLMKGVTSGFTPSTEEETVRALLTELSAPLMHVFTDWNDVIDKSRPFRLYCDASTDDLEAKLEQEQPDGSICPIVYSIT